MIKLTDRDIEIFKIISEWLNFKNYKPKRGKSKSGRYKYLKNIKDLEGRGIEKTIIPFNNFHIYTRLEVLLGLKLSGHTDTLTEASNLLVEL